MEKLLDLGKKLLVIAAVFVVEGELFYLWIVSLDLFPIATAKDITYRLAFGSSILTIYLWNKLDVTWIKK